MISQQLFPLSMLPSEQTSKCWPQWPQITINQQHLQQQNLPVNFPELQKISKDKNQQQLNNRMLSQDELSQQFSFQLNQVDQVKNSMDIENNESRHHQTIGDLIKNIQFQNRKQDIIQKRKKKNMSTSSKQSVSSFASDSKQLKNQQSKSWDKQQEELFKQLLNKYGTDFNIIKQFLPKKSKNQIKNKYRLLCSKKKSPKQKIKINKSAFEKNQKKKNKSASTEKVQEVNVVRQVDVQVQSENQNHK